MPDFEPIPCAGGRDGFECSHCGGFAVCPGDGGELPEAEACEECGYPGALVALHGTDGGVAWEADASGTCDRDDCVACGTWRGERHS